MQEFTAKKLGEVVAFSRIGCEVAERGGAAFVDALGEEVASDFTSKLKEFAGTATAHGTETTLEKADKTEVKLRSMMEQYIGDEWDNPVELLEWLSFFTGSASAHWALVHAAAQGESIEDLAVVAKTAKEQYHTYLHTTIEMLEAEGAKRVAG